MTNPTPEQKLTPQPGARMTDEDMQRNALVLAHLKHSEKRFSGEAPTLWGAL